MKLLLIGDESKNRQLLKRELANTDWDLATATTPTALERALSVGTCDLIMLDWTITRSRRAELLQSVRRVAPATPLVALTRCDMHREEAEDADVRACVQPPVTSHRLCELMTNGEPGCGTARKAPADSAAGDLAGGDDFISASPLMGQVFQTAWKAARTQATVLITGENGTGKTMLARAIHQRSGRRDGPFVTVSCPGLQARLVESELFGHARGSFTGAINDTVGKVTAAEGGTLFLDEVGELPPEIQPKLLRLLQDRIYEKLGEVRTRVADVRVIAATNRDLKAEAAGGRFREDLFYRLNVIPLEILPLRHRPEDIMPFAGRFFSQSRHAMGRPAAGFSEQAREILVTHRWPGNLRELRNAVERASILSDHPTLDGSDFGEMSLLRSAEQLRVGDFVKLDVLAQEHVRMVSEGATDYQEAARILGINTSTLYRWRKRAEAAVARFEPEPVAKCAG